MPTGSNLALKIVPPAPPSAVGALFRMKARLLAAIGLGEAVRPRLYVVGADGLTPIVRHRVQNNRARSLQQLLARVYAKNSKRTEA